MNCRLSGYCTGSGFWAALLRAYASKTTLHGTLKGRQRFGFRSEEYEPDERLGYGSHEGGGSLGAGICFRAQGQG